MALRGEVPFDNPPADGRAREGERDYAGNQRDPQPDCRISEAARMLS